MLPGNYGGGGGISNIGDNWPLHLIHAFVTFRGPSNLFRFHWEGGALVGKASAFQPTTGVWLGRNVTKKKHHPYHQTSRVAKLV
jgi:hypothetical protein